jgi:dTDP-4-amino-4,6-dideoxygalactose transaminase
MNIPFLNLKASHAELKTQLDPLIYDFLDSGIYILGNSVETFEKNYAIFCNSDYAIGVANGLDALTLSLKALGIKEGDEVIVPSHTFIATWLAVIHAGAKPVPVDFDLNTYNLDPSKLYDSLTNKTKAIIAVHLYGHPADLDKISDFATSNNLFVIEDAAQAHGAKYKGVPIGSHSDLVCWSFYPGKNLGAYGDAGAVTTNNELLAFKLKELRNYGSHIKYVHNSLGFNSRLDSLQAVILNHKLSLLSQWNNRRKKVASYYLNNIKNPYILLPKTESWAEHSWHLFVVRSLFRNKLQEALRTKGIETLIHYPIPVHLQTAFACYDFNNFDFSNAFIASEQVLSLPMGPHISDNEISYITDTINCLTFN